MDELFSMQALQCVSTLALAGAILNSGVKSKADKMLIGLVTIMQVITICACICHRMRL